MKGLSHLKNKQFTPLVMAMILASVTGNLFANKGLEIAILSDKNNDNFIVINKPSGIPVQSGTKSFKNIIDILKNTKLTVC